MDVLPLISQSSLTLEFPGSFFSCSWPQNNNISSFRMKMQHGNVIFGQQNAHGAGYWKVNDSGVWWWTSSLCVSCSQEIISCQHSVSTSIDLFVGRLHSLGEGREGCGVVWVQLDHVCPQELLSRFHLPHSESPGAVEQGVSWGKIPKITWFPWIPVAERGFGDCRLQMLPLRVL